MKTIKNTILVILLLVLKHHVDAQGFVNLNFESANVSGYPINSSDVPINSALPGWSGFYGGNPTSQVWYDGISTGGNMISLVDNNAAISPFHAIQGNYSAFLFGGDDLSASISQTGVISAGTQSLTMEAWEYGSSPIVAINGQPINMIPLETTSYYTVYGGSIPSFDVGPSVTLSFTAPLEEPSEFELDNILFSTSVLTPEPSIVALAGIGGLLFGARKRFARR
jgi:hypothetical protein